jgi:hypothetical protein
MILVLLNLIVAVIAARRANVTGIAVIAAARERSPDRSQQLCQQADSLGASMHVQCGAARRGRAGRNVERARRDLEKQERGTEGREQSCIPAPTTT